MRKFKALKIEKGRDDFGASGITFEVDQLIEGKIYIQQDTKYWDEHAKRSAPFFVDDNGCSRDISDCLKKGIIIEMFS
jgi:hypothetical protein